MRLKSVINNVILTYFALLWKPLTFLRHLTKWQLVSSGHANFSLRQCFSATTQKAITLLLSDGSRGLPLWHYYYLTHSSAWILRRGKAFTVCISFLYSPFMKSELLPWGLETWWPATTSNIVIIFHDGSHVFCLFTELNLN